jgi:hypothetical protein
MPIFMKKEKESGCANAPIISTITIEAVIKKRVLIN